MAVFTQELIEKRGMERRVEDRNILETMRQQQKLFQVGQIITSEMDIEVLFKVIMDETNKIMGTERSTVFLHDSETEELWSLVATGMKKNEIRIPADYGVAGRAFQNCAPLTINDAYKNPIFYKEIDKKSGFRTQNILCIPLKNRRNQCIGALQAINKKSSEFNGGDQKLLTSISHYVAIALENARLYEDVKNYSEELKTKLIHIETLEKVKSQLTKFVPTSVRKLVEEDPDKRIFEKVPMDVSVLFIDIQGFSKITESYDQKLVNDMVESHFSSYLECIYRHGGEVNETSGDGLMVIFKDAPTEMLARKAVAAGLEIIIENKRLNNEIVFPWGPVDLHMGINTGEAWVGSTKMKTLAGERWTYTASGLVTVLAARIGARSSDTRLFVGPETYRGIKGSCECEFMGAQELKNVKAPVSIYWVKDISGPGQTTGCSGTCRW
jgi:class 3 adenylate cyclase